MATPAPLLLRMLSFWLWQVMLAEEQALLQTYTGRVSNFT